MKSAQVITRPPPSDSSRNGVPALRATSGARAADGTSAREPVSPVLPRHLPLRAVQNRAAGLRRDTWPAISSSNSPLTTLLPLVRRAVQDRPPRRAPAAAEILPRLQAHRRQGSPSVFVRATA